MEAVRHKLKRAALGVNTEIERENNKGLFSSSFPVLLKRRFPPVRRVEMSGSEEQMRSQKDVSEEVLERDESKRLTEGSRKRRKKQKK
jgi:hypothetical protein